MTETNTIIVGAGPIGIEVAAALKACGDDTIHLEAGQIGATILNYPRNTVFFSSPDWISICGIPIQTRDQRRITGEEYLAYLRQVVEILDLRIDTYERVEAIAPTASRGMRFRLETSRFSGTGVYACRNVVLAIGDMNHPNRLDIPGEELPFVSHRFDDPHRYFRKRLLIVGGRNSALEAALRSWRVGAQVALSYRRAQIAKKGILARLKLEISILASKRQVELLPRTKPVRIEPGRIELVGEPGGRRIVRDVDFVLLAIGFRPDWRLYRQLDIRLEGTERSPVFDGRSMETSVKGVFVAGTTTAGNQQRYQVFISTCHDHATKIARAITGKDYLRIGNLPKRNFVLQPADIE